MQRTTTAVLVALLVTIAALGSAGAAMAFTNDDQAPSSLQGTQDSDSRTISVSANGQAETQPDKAVLRLAVEADAPDATTARTQVAENVTAVTEALAELGISEDQIRTTDYRINRDDHPRPRDDEKPTDPVFRARHVLSIDVENVDQVGKVIDVAIDAGATDIYDVQFTLAEDTRQELKSQALTAAMENARSQAETLATSENLTITGANDIRTVDHDRPIYRAETAMAADAAGGTDISSGPVSVTAQVTVTYNATG